jgi:hypothetical protein
MDSIGWGHLAGALKSIRFSRQRLFSKGAAAFSECACEIYELER